MACLLNQTRHRSSFLKTDLDSEVEKLFITCLRPPTDDYFFIIILIFQNQWQEKKLSHSNKNTDFYEKIKGNYVMFGFSLSIIQF